MGNTVLGVSIMLISTSMMNVGSVIQKKAVDRLPSFDDRSLGTNIKAVLGTPLWLIGWVMNTSAIVLNMVALGYADISVIQPLNGFGLVVLAVFSRYYLGERLTRTTLIGIAGVIAGVALIGATVPESRSFADADELLGSYVHGSALAALGAFVAVIAILWSVARRWPRISGILFAFVAACCSVVGLTFSKGLFGLFAIVGMGSALALWPSYLLLALLLGFATTALMLQQLSFQKGRAVVVTPVFAATSVVFPLAMGSLVFGEHIEWLTLLAVLFIVVGVIFLSLRTDEAEQPASEGVEER